MTTAYTTLRSRLNEVIEQAHQVMNEAVMAGHVTSDAVPDKVQHLINLVRKFAQVADAQAQAPASFSDYEAAPTSAHVDVVNVVNMPAQLPTQELSVDVRPSMQFVRLTCGIVNLQHIVFLDVASKRLYVAGGIMIALADTDVTALKYYLKLYAITN
jgi:hypothetical protein